jgi:hypothetical protein
MTEGPGVDRKPSRSQDGPSGSQEKKEKKKQASAMASRRGWTRGRGLTSSPGAAPGEGLRSNWQRRRPAGLVMYSNVRALV